MYYYEFKVLHSNASCPITYNGYVFATSETIAKTMILDHYGYSQLKSLTLTATSIIEMPNKIIRD